MSNSVKLLNYCLSGSPPPWLDGCEADTGENFLSFFEYHVQFFLHVKWYVKNNLRLFQQMLQVI